MSYNGDGNSPEYHKFVIMKCNEILKTIQLEKTERWNDTFDVIKDMVEDLIKTENNLLDTEMGKLRRVVITGDGFQRDGIFRKVVGIKIKLSGYNSEGKLYPLEPIMLREFDQINLNLYSPYNPEKKK